MRGRTNIVSSSGGMTVETDFYPFPTLDAISSKFQIDKLYTYTLSAKQLSNVKKITLNGTFGCSGGGTESKFMSYFVDIIAKAKTSNVLYYYDLSKKVFTRMGTPNTKSPSMLYISPDITRNELQGTYWANATLTTATLNNYEIDVEAILNELNNKSLTFELSGIFVKPTNLAYGSGRSYAFVNEYIYSPFIIGCHFYKYADTDSNLFYMGYTVKNSVSSINDFYDSPSDIENNPPQIKVEYV